jgi:hypothetical protein
VKLSRAAVAKLLPGTCAPKGKVQLNPEAIEAIHAAGTTPSAQGLGYTGAGVTVAYIAGTGDLWLGSTNPAATFAPYVAQPGQSVSIPVTITPEGKAGTWCPEPSTSPIPRCLLRAAGGIRGRADGQ